MARSRILVVDDERMIRWSIQQALVKDGFAVSTVETGEEAVAQAADEPPDLVLLDITLPGMDGIEVLRRLKSQDPAITVVMLTAIEELKVVVEAMRLGAYDYVSKPFDLDRLRVIVQNALDRRELRQEVEFHRKESVRRYGFHRIVGESPGLREVVGIARKVAKSEAATVLLQGESGTGKDLIAQAIHYESSRANRPFIPINCTALPEELLESELMGHEKGAFTDAKMAKKGLFEVADGGTIFLDEIGDMKHGLQAKLLRFIENKAFRRVGGHRDIEVDVRIIAATNRDLAALVRTGEFREDLFFRLNVIPIHIPPLRERREDILPLADHFLSDFSKEFKRPLDGFSEDARKRMAAYGWPGNVRELRNVIERAIILGSDGIVDTLDLPRGDASLQVSDNTIESSLSAPVSWAPPTSIAGTGGGHGFRLPHSGIVLEELERDFLTQALEMTQGNQTKAAEALGLTRDALRYRMKKFGLM
ncbi:MAG: sigma-54-dependent Fis family transcriptional regulator [Deltaproteobacteria bacterium]|nr:MAG: sigma-54-dependent Fis family transcriptional regulator [Deltaproteobacteria bacterium]